jgi:penicillin amidase
MRPIFRRAVRAVVVGATLLAVFALALAFWLVRRAWPEHQGRLIVPGLHGPVEVVRDALGVPHIYAGDEHDLLFGQGYVHAQDRLWQMHFNRTVSGGLLSSILGAGTLEADRYFRTLGLRRAAEKDWEALQPETRTALQAYADGVNAYRATHGGRLPIEFLLLGTDPAPWTPLDTLAFGKLMALNLGLNHSFELMRERIRLKAGAEAARRFVPPYPLEGPLVLGAGLRTTANPRGGWSGAYALSSVLASPIGGSNNWVVHGSRTASGKPLLANDTHLGLTMPSIWYENGLHGGGLEVVGFSLPGIPGVVMGHNGRIAWGISNMCADVQDFYLERLDDPVRPSRYLFRGEWKDLATVEESIPVKGAPPASLKVLSTHHGPVLSDALKELKPPEVVALRWTALDGGRLATAILRLNRAGDWASFRSALSDWVTPNLNFVYADLDGNIGYQSTGRIPLRPKTDDGAAPVPGWDGEHEWQGFIPFDELPSAFNPARGFIVTANNKAVSEEYPYRLGVDFADPYRAQRITDLLAARDRATLEDMQSIQAQTYSPAASALRSYVADLQPRTAEEGQAIAVVRDWDLHEEADRAGAAIFNVWYYFLMSHVVRNALGDELWNEDKQFHITLAPMLARLMAEPDSRLFDDPQTPAVEKRDDVALQSVAEAVAWLRARLGADMRRWSWGAIHRVTFAHQPLGMSGISLLERAFNGPARPARGGTFTVDSALPSLEKPFTAVFGVSQRMIVDLAHLDGSVSVNSTGQSERLLHPHRDDQIGMWQAVEYHPMRWSRAAVAAAARDRLTLVPR